ncbi:MAG TPA: hypothetical protein O0Y15_05250 [Methanocorpusculum sp.]|nr:hypothetical protein [Methanocorpusculaceae archaeon]HJJ61698.1 hypothetical protein [Methanocorpusculum sp.]HJJ80226.1 hypothetical protein [Methanocorpusculum sp.]HJJ88213.1 hypothetical protein [Methanocorpusculum sp.]HJJ92195.1 hypothetical protein [Methanocorpusculum sp.]
MTADFREESCTYLMLKLKVALKKADGPFSFLGTSTQVNTVKGGFQKSKYEVSVEEKPETDTYLITLTPIKK